MIDRENFRWMRRRGSGVLVAGLASLTWPAIVIFGIALGLLATGLESLP